LLYTRNGSFFDSPCNLQVSFRNQRSQANIKSWFGLWSSSAVHVNLILLRNLIKTAKLDERRTDQRITSLTQPFFVLFQVSSKVISKLYLTRLVHFGSLFVTAVSTKMNHGD